MIQAKNAQRALILAALTMLVGSSFVACGQFGKRKVNNGAIALEDRHAATANEPTAGDNAVVGAVDEITASAEKQTSMITVRTKIEVDGAAPSVAEVTINKLGTTAARIQKDMTLSSGGIMGYFKTYKTVHTDISFKCVNSNRLASFVTSDVGDCPVVGVIVEVTGDDKDNRYSFAAVDQKIALYERQANGELDPLMIEPLKGGISDDFFDVSMYDAGASEDYLIEMAINKLVNNL